jgi:hypothetical protein
MPRFDFDDIRESIEPNFMVITKIEVIDGVEIDLYEGSFQALAIAPDPDNGNRVTLWYTRPAEMRSQLRQATGEINDLVERFLEQGNDTPDSPPGVDDFLRKLLSDINEEDE